MNRLAITRLASGGLITNYYCSSRCRHCLYGCSPDWEKRYITRDQAGDNFRAVKSLKCRSVHIGGGEPFLNPDGLKEVVREAFDQGVSIEYIETNSSWFIDEPGAVELLSEIRHLGVSTLLVSISPFHNEHIPFRKVLGVMEACRRSGLTVFPWVQGFVSDISSFDVDTIHSLKEYTGRFGAGYVAGIPDRYWMHFGGRAIETFRDLFSPRPASIIAGSCCGCRELADTSHFHLDLFGNYVPGLCSGLAIRSPDLRRPLTVTDYPIITTLFNRGVAGLYEIAVSEYGFAPADGYLSKCHLCLSIRKYLVMVKKIDSPELQPNQFYENV